MGSSILPLIIMLIVGALMSGRKKQSSQQEQSKPFTAQQEHRDDPIKRLKEKSREMYRELQQEIQQEAERQKPIAQRQERTVSHKPVVVTPEVDEVSKPPRRERNTGSKGRRSANLATSSHVQMERSKINTESLLPKNEEDLIKGVIFSEIFGPPKSRR